MTASYYSQLTEGFARGWNRFWFAPSDPISFCLIRIACGLAALYYIASHSADLIHWWGPNGILPVETVQQLTGATDSGGGSQITFHLSYLNYFSSPTELWIVHILGIAVLLAFTLGLFTRVTSVLSLVVVLSYIHRAPMLTGPFEPVLTMSLVYLCIAPAGGYLSVDRWLRNRKAVATPKDNAVEENESDKPSSSATVALRLMQVHLAAFYLMMGLTKLAGEAWWNGEAVWWLIARTESRLVDLTALHNTPFLINAWTHAIVLFEIAFALLIWNRLARPLLLGMAVFMWLSLALITGLASFCLMMLAANLVFLSPETTRRLLRRLPAAAIS